MPDEDIPQARQPVDVALAIDIPEDGAFTAVEDDRFGMVGRMVLWVEEVCVVEGEEGSVIVRVLVNFLGTVGRESRTHQCGTIPTPSGECGDRDDRMPAGSRGSDIVSTFTLPSRWHKDHWNKVGQVAFTSRGGSGSIDPNDSVHGALLAKGLELHMEPLHDAHGNVNGSFKTADVVISGVGLTAHDIEQFHHARLILRPFVGYDDIDVDAATANGILFANIPDAFSEEVANHALALILGMNQQLLISDHFVRSGAWADQRSRPKRAVPVHRLSVQTVGLIGFGVIARLTAERLRPFGFKVLAYDPYVTQEVADGYGVTMASFDDVLSHSDFVSVHTFLAASTRHLINAERLAQMKQGAYLINTARGPIVDEAALIEAIKSGHLAGAGLDVTEVEPLAKDSPLHALPNVILTPHMSSESVEAGLAVRRRTHEIASSVATGGLPDRHVCQNRPLFDQIKEALGH